jgi:prepilin-type N-terminal cleavage/methylation domain-containing protein
MRNSTRQNVKGGRRKSQPGFTLIELIIAMALNLVVVLAAGTLLVNGNRAWQNTLDLVNGEVQQDALAVSTAFGNIGRKSNRVDYTIYDISGTTFTPALPKTSDPKEVVSGNALEFRYWDVELDKTDSHSLMDVTKTATAYALFYLDGDKLKVDYGPCPPGGVPDGGGIRNTSGVVTTTLANHVSVDPSTGAGAFSHTTVSGVGQGSVRIDIVITDPATKKSTKVITSTLLRNIWPR